MKKHPIAAFVALMTLSAAAFAVTSVIHRQNSIDQFQKGTTENTMVDSQGTILLAPRTEKISIQPYLKDIWTVNAILTDNDGTTYLGTSPNGQLLKISQGKATQIYPAEKNESGLPDPNSPSKDTIRNEHIFALAKDLAGRLLAGVSGQKGKLLRISAAQTETIFESDQVKYIFAIVLDKQNNIYLGTGPNGLVYKLDPFGQNPQILYDSPDKNILSLAVGSDGVLYAGSDQRGLIYKINTDSGQASVLFDSDLEEITALVADGQGRLYAAATSSGQAAQQLQAAVTALKKAPGRPDNASGKSAAGTQGLNLQTPNSDETKQPPQKPQPSTPPKPTVMKSVSYVYRISPEGFVTELFSEKALFYSLQMSGDILYLGTGNEGKLFRIDPASEQKAVAWQDKRTSQITAIAWADSILYLGLSNPAAAVKLYPDYESKGTYTSDLIDAGQPAQWGKLQIDADIPAGCSILMSARSGNVKDPNDPTFSAWTAAVPVSGPVELNCPLGRFCQYRLTLNTSDRGASPVIREVSLASVIPNLPPEIQALTVARSPDKQKPHIFVIAAMPEDANRDQLLFKIEFRKAGRTGWITLKKNLDQPKFEWDSRTVEDGRYEIRLTADDRLSNNPQTTLTGARISDTFVLDNTPPQITEEKIEITGRTASIRLEVGDELSIVGKLLFTIDSNELWQACVPDDKVFDTTNEQFAVRIENLDPGRHVIAFAASDDLGNIAYKTFLVEIPENEQKAAQ